MVDNKTSNKIEDLINIKKSLEEKVVIDLKKEDDIKKNLLEHLKVMEVSYNDLVVAKIAKSVLKLSKHNDKEISTLANEVVNLWKKKCKKPADDDKSKTHVTQTKEQTNQFQQINTNRNNLENKQKIEISNNKSYSKSLFEKIKESIKDLNDTKRNNFRQLFFDSLVHKDDDSNKTGINSNEEFLLQCKDLAISIEENLYNLVYSTNDKGSKYISKGKSIFTNLKNKSNELRENVLNGSITPKALSAMDVRDMASQQLKLIRQQTVEEDFNSRRSDWNKLHSTVENGIYKCKVCKGSRTSKFQLQMRSADEPMTTFINCIDCGNQWKHN